MRGDNVAATGWPELTDRVFTDRSAVVRGHRRGPWLRTNLTDLSAILRRQALYIAGGGTCIVDGSSHYPDDIRPPSGDHRRARGGDRRRNVTENLVAIVESNRLT